MELKDDPKAKNLVADKAMKLFDFLQSDCSFHCLLSLVAVLVQRALKFGMSKEMLLSLVSDTYETAPLPPPEPFKPRLVK